jgi:hypothetical protein
LRNYSKSNKGKEYVDKIIKFDYNKKYFANTPIVLQRFPDARGRVLFAKERIEAGQVILISKPYALTVRDDYKSQVCSKCHNKLELAEEIIQSKYVKSRQYCCRHCYESSELLDYLEAKAMKRINMLPKSFLRQGAGDSKDTAELILRILTRKFIEERPRMNFKNVPLPPKLSDDAKPNVNNDTSDLITASNKSSFGGKNGAVRQQLFDDGLIYEDVERLVANMGAVPEKRQVETEDILKALQQCLDPRILVPDDDIRELVCRIDCNSFAIDKYEKRALMEQDTADATAPKPTEVWSGNGLYLTASYFNHSCTPNCRFYHDMDCNLVIETRRAIDAGEELTVSYGLGVNGNEDIDEIRDICKREVQKTFRFSCNCSSGKKKSN